MERDPRAVENPIGAMFDLSEDVVQQASAIRRAVRYATVFMGVWLAINLLLVIIYLFTNFILFLTMTALFAIGVMAIVPLRKAAAFFSYYVVRHAAIKAVRDADPLVYAPRGATPAERLVGYLRATSPMMSSGGAELAMPGIVEGANRLQYKFDVYARREPGALWRPLGIGEPGFAIFVKVFEARPKPEDVVSFRKAVEDVSARTRIPPTRAIILWKNSAGEPLDDATYGAVMGNQVRLPKALSTATCAIELITELPSGEYDFSPFMAGAVARPAGSPPNA